MPIITIRGISVAWLEKYEQQLIEQLKLTGTLVPGLSIPPGHILVYPLARIGKDRRGNPTALAATIELFQAEERTPERVQQFAAVVAAVLRAHFKLAEIGVYPSFLDKSLAADQEAVKKELNLFGQLCSLCGTKMSETCGPEQLCPNCGYVLR